MRAIGGSNCDLSCGDAVSNSKTHFPVVEKTIAQLRSALEQGEVTSVELVQSYLHRIDTYDQNGIRLNSVVEITVTDLL